MKVYLIGASQFDAATYLTFVRENATPADGLPAEVELWKRTDDATPPEELIEASGRVCYMSFGPRQSPKTNQEYIRHLIKMGHESVLEHVDWSFLITGVSRALTHQLVRHRVGFAFSQLSQQYVDDVDPEFVEPPFLKRFPKAEAAWRRAMEVASESYREILQELHQIDPSDVPELEKREIDRAIRSTARSVLPNATATTMMATINGRALRHFLKVRGGIPGDEEMRALAAELLQIVRAEAPAIVSDFELGSYSDGTPVVIHRPQRDDSQ